jgi:NAD(P)-dependent dehydrogenase (short-subunit alcohol dehydrogenase family)
MGTQTSAASVLITGPTRGLGAALLQPVMSRSPAGLMLLGRASLMLDAAVDGAREWARSACPVAALPLELGDLESVAAAGALAVSLVDAGHPPLTAVILNAGLQTADRTQTSTQGIELTFAVNVVAQHLLLRALLPALAPDAHVVMLGSGTHFGDWHSFGMVPAPAWSAPAALAVSDTRPDDPQAGGRAYSTSKLAVIYLAHEWQRRFGSRLRVNVADPGLMPGTGLARQLPRLQQWAWNNVLPGVSAVPGVPGISTPKRSARQLAAFALGEAHPTMAGGYLDQGRVKSSSPASYDQAREAELWNACAELTAPFLS